MTQRVKEEQAWRRSHRRSVAVTVEGARVSLQQRHAEPDIVQNDAWTFPGGQRTSTLRDLMKLQLDLARTYVRELPTLARTRHQPRLQRRRVRLTQELLAAISNELEELRDEMPWKPWRATFRMSKTQYDNLAYELVDVLHFLLELALVWGLTADDLVSCYLVKRQHNLTRPEHVHR